MARPMTELRTVHIYLPVLAVGGGELSMMRLAEGMARRGVDVSFVLQSHDPSRLPPGLSTPVHCLHTHGSLNSVRALASHLQQHRPQALLSAFPHTNVAAAAARAWSGISSGVLVLSEHAPPTQQIQQQGGWRFKALPPLLRWAYPRADAVVGVSQGVCDDLQHLVGQGLKPRCIYNPVLPADLSARMAESVAHPWLSDPDVEVVMTLSRLAPEKGLATVLHAFARLAPQRPRARLLMVGDGSERAALQALAQQLGVARRCDWPGMVNQPFAWLARAKVFVLASHFEGFGNVLVEALACGLPVVSTDCPVGPREILQGGRHGALVPVGEPQPMARALALALEQGPNPAAQAHAMQFSESRATDAYLGVMRSCLAARQVSKVQHPVPR